MDLDYDIYSYIARGIGEGILVLQLANEKVTYEEVGIDSINLNNKSFDSFTRYQLQLLDKNGKRIYRLDGNPVIYYETDDSLKQKYIKVIGKKNIFKKRQSDYIVFRVPKTVKLPLDKDTNKLITLEEGKWIDITDINNLKFYSDNEFNMIFEVVEEKNKKILERV